VETPILRIFQGEVVKQCRYAILAIEDLENALKGMNEQKLTTSYGMSRIWFSIQAFLVATGNLSKLLWPPAPHIPERGTELRASLSVDEDSCLQPRTFRNHFEHYDERLEKFLLSLEPPNFSYIDSNVSPGGIKSLAPYVDEKLVLRHFDQKTWTLIFRGETFHLEPLFKAICELLPKAEKESDKGAFTE
jgi:hypothetical protein